MQILIASDHYPPYIGGAHRQTQLVSRELHKRGHTVSVATVWQPGLQYLEDDDGVQVYRLKQLRTLFTVNPRDHNQRHQPPFPDPVTVGELRRLFKELKPEVIHSHGWFSYSCAAALLGMDIPLVISGRDYGYSCATRTLLFHDKVCDGPALAKCLGCAASFYGAPKGFAAVLGLSASQPWLRRKVRAIHSVSGYVQEVIERDFFGDRRAQLESAGGPILESVIPSFLVDQEETSPDPAFMEHLPDRPYILFVGGLQQRKGLGELLLAYMQLIAPPPLVLIGYATNDVPKSYPKGVVVLLDVPHAGVMQAWENCLFGVVPSVWPDPSPGVVREAFSKGKTVIGTSIGGTPEMIIDGETGLLVQAGDTLRLASAMQRLIDDPVLRQKLGQAALCKANRYRAEIIVPQFERLYQRVIEATHHQVAQK